MTYRPIMSLIQAQHWIETSCQVDKSEVIQNMSRNHGRSSSTYKVDIHYHYQYDGTTYKGNKYRFEDFYSSGYGDKQQIVDTYPPGFTFNCYVNPNNPSESVIVRKPGWYLLMSLFPLPFLLVGIWGMMDSFKKNDLYQSGDKLSQAKIKTNIILQEEMSPIKSFLLILCFCLFWNGAVAALITQWWLPSYHASHSIPIFDTIFASVFVISGVILIYGVFYNFLCLFNPTMIIEISPGWLQPGGQYQLTYKINGNVNRLTDLSLKLVGKEVISYASGRSSREENATIHETVILQQVSKRLSPNGTAELNIPLNIMPSFTSSHNKIVWTIVAHGNIPFWPDMNHDYVITIAANEQGVESWLSL